MKFSGDTYKSLTSLVTFYLSALISTKTGKHGFSPAAFRSRLEQKSPLLNVFFLEFVFCFPWRNLCKERVAVFVSVAIPYESLHGISGNKANARSRCTSTLKQKNELLTR